MTKKYHRVRISVIVLAVAVVVGLVGVVAVIERTKDPDYWLSGIALVSTVVLPILGKLVRDGSPAERALLDGAEAKLRKALFEQWKKDVDGRISDPYALPVPFSVLTSIGTEVAGEPGREADGHTTRRIMASWAAVRGKPGAEPLELDGTFESIAEVFTRDGVPGRLIVVGAPGSGKSTIAQWLTVKLLENGGQGTQVPVFLPLATWNPKEPLRNWAASQLAQTHRWLAESIQTTRGQVRTLAQALIEDDRILMVLDGLDEIPPEHRSRALHKLSESAKQNHTFVVTCRTSDYAAIVSESGRPLAKTPVIALGPLPVSDVVAYLRAAEAEHDPDRWADVLKRLETEPDGPLATALSTSLALWLVLTYFREPQHDPNVLLGPATEQEIVDLLLDGLVDAVYSTETMDHPAQPDARQREVERERLAYLARFLSDRGKSQGIEWWHLPQAAPRAFIGGTIGLIVGCMLGVSAGLAGAAKFGTQAGVVLGFAFALVTGVLCGVTSVRWQENPRTIDIGMRWSFQRFTGCLAVGIAAGAAFGVSAEHGGGLVPGLATMALTGPICAAAAIPAFGRAPGITTGISAALAIGLAGALASHSTHPVVSGVVTGVVFAASMWIFIGLYRPSQSSIAASPESLLLADRSGSIIVGVTAGVAVGVLYGLALGPVIGVVGALGVAVAVVATVSMWGVFSLTRLWFALSHKLPLDVMDFLQEAHDRGVLRRIGGAYQFRHEILQKRLVQ